MSFDFRLPKITGTDSEKIEHLTRYIYRLTEQLNFSLNTIEGAVRETSGGSPAAAPSAAKSEEEKLEGAYDSIKSMIIKSADVIESLTDKVSVSLGGAYLAKSEFGTYKEETKATLEANSTGITQLYSYTSNLQSDYADYEVENKSYIKTGLLYYDDSQPVCGVGVGLLNATTDANGRRTLDRQNLATTFTAGKISFWGNNTELAYITPSEIYFPEGVLKAYGAKIEGDITATAGTIGGCLIKDGVLKITEANIDGKLTASHIDASDLKVSAANITGQLTIGKQLPSNIATQNDIPTVPTKMSELTNDSGYQTESGVTTIIGNTVTTGYINALGISAASLNVAGKFSADKDAGGVTVGGFIVEADNIHSATGKQGTFKGTTTGGSYISYAVGYMFTYFLSSDGGGIVYRLYPFNDTSDNYLNEFRSYEIVTSSSGGGTVTA